MTSTATSAQAPTAAEGRTGPMDRRLQLRLAALVVLVALAFWDLVRYETYRKVAEQLEGADEFFFSPTGASPGFVLGIAVYLLYHRHRGLVASLATPGRMGVALPLLLVSALSLGWAQYTGARHLVPISLSLFLLGAAEAMGGRRAMRAVLPSAALLWMLVPFPPGLFNLLMYQLQVAIASVTTVLVSWMGIETFQAGSLIVTGRGVFQVIESCTGLRITETLLATAPLYAALFHRSDARMLLLVAVTPLIGMIANELRVVSLVLTPFSVFHEVHFVQGLVFLVIGVLGIAGIDGLLERRGLLPRVPGSPEAGTAASPAIVGRRAGLCLVAAAALVGLRFGVPAWESTAPDPGSVQRLRTELRRIPSTGEKIDNLFLGSVRYADRFYRRYDFEGAQIGLFVGTDDRGSLGHSPESRKTELVRPGSLVLRRWQRPARAGVRQYALVTWSPLTRERHLAVVSYGGLGSISEDALRYALALDRTPWQRTEPVWVVRLDVAIDGDEASIERGLARIDAFAEQIGEPLERVGVPLGASSPALVP